MPLKSWTWKYRDHDLRAEVWWQWLGWRRRERVYVDHDLASERRGHVPGNPPLRFSINNEAANTEDQFELAFRTPFSISLGKWRFAIGPRQCRVSVNGLPWPLQSGRVQVYKTWQYSENKSISLEPSSFVLLVLGPLLIVWIVVCSPIILCLGLATELIANWWLTKKLRRQGRFLLWSAVEERMRQAPSTLIFEKRLGSDRTWWTAEDVVAQSPLPPTSDEEIWSLGRTATNPFAEWCYYNYLSDTTGKAYLTRPPKEWQPQIAGAFRAVSASNPAVRAHPEYPLLKMVLIPVLAYSKETMEAFALALGSAREVDISNLTLAAGASNPGLRHLAVHALRLLGPRAKAALPTLVEQLYHGPWTERDDVAKAVGALGSDGVECLRAASIHDDPWIRDPAENALEALKLPCGNPDSLIRQHAKGLISASRLSQLLLQHLTKANTADILSRLSRRCLANLKTLANNDLAGLCFEERPQWREGIEAIKNHMAERGEGS